jgi:hypothetical protein
MDHNAPLCKRQRPADAYSKINRPCVRELANRRSQILASVRRSRVSFPGGLKSIGLRAAPKSLGDRVTGAVESKISAPGAFSHRSL